MASIVVAGDTSGTVTLAAPAVSGTTTLTLPTTSGTIVTTSGAQTIEFADGSASAPSITNSGDTNTGMFFPAADTIAFAEGGTESMRIDSSGNVGIGTSSPVNIAGYTIQTINNASNGGGVYLQSNGTTIGRILNTATDCFVGGVSASSGLVLQSGGVVRMNIDSSGNFSAVIPSGNTYYPAFWCRAWVNFNGTGVVAIRASGNVTSITDNGVGNYTVNFTTAMPDANYAACTSAIQDFWSTAAGAASYATSSVVIRVTGETAYRDLPNISVSIFR